MDPANASERDRQSALRCDPLVPRPNNVVPGLHANAEWPDYIDIVRPTQLFVLPGPHPGTFCMPGQARYRFIFDREPETNLHAGASYIKYLADMLVRALDFSGTRLCNSWESDTSRADRPSIAYLSGMHSYATGDPVPIPMWAYLTVATAFAAIILAYKNRDLKNID